MLHGLLNDRYRLESELGRGGMAVVYRGHDALLDRAVAVKVLLREAIGEAGGPRLLAEARSAARLNHPGIVAVYDVGEAFSQDGAASPYIVMERIDGEPLNARPHPELTEIVAIAGQVCEALEHAHRNGVVHRDLKPENVLLQPDGRVKLTDFGLAQSMASRVTSSGAVVGTVYYIAPEQAMGRPVDGRADLYALGVVLYELVAGRLPFLAETSLAVISLHLNAPVVPPSAHRPDLPPGLEDLILDLLAKRPEDRPADAAEVGRRLRDALTAPTASSAERSLLERIVRGRLVGRERELAEALGHWSQAAGGAGHVLLISGEPGVGKTRLVREVLAHIEATGGRVISGECYAEGGAPFSPVAESIRRGLTLIGADALPEPILAELATIAPELALRFPRLPPNPTLEGAGQQQRAFEAYSLFTEACAAGDPLALFFDDVHWADAGTLQLIHHLARRIRRQPVLLILTYREIELDENPPLGRLLGDLNRERLAVRLKLGRLSREQTEALLQAMFAEPVTPEFLDGIFQESEGNPFFVEELCKALVDSGRLRFEAGRWHRPPVADLEIPQSVRGAILTRVDKLPEAAREAMLMAAILGREFEFEALRRASELPEEVLIGALEAAERAQLIGETRRHGDVTFSFLHALIPASLAESVSVLRRKLLHRRAAQAIESLSPLAHEVLMYHWIEAGDDDRARQAAVAAGDRAHASLGRAEGVRFYQAALERWPEDDLAGRAEILTRLGDCLHVSVAAGAKKTYFAARDLYQRLGDPIGTGDLERRIGRLFYEDGDRRQALEHFHRALALLEQGPPGPALAYAVSSISAMHMLASELLEARRWGERALDLAAQTGSEAARVHALNNVGVSYMGTGDIERGLAMLEESAEGAIAAGLVHDACRAYLNMASVQLAVGRYRPSIAAFRRAIEFAERYHVYGFSVAAQQECGAAHWRSGEWRAAQEFDRLARGSPFFAGLTAAWDTSHRATVDIDLGRPQEAVRILNAARERLLSQLDEPQTVFPLLTETIRAAAAVDEDATTEQAVEAMVARIDGSETTHPEAAVAMLETIRWRLGRSQHAPDVTGHLDRLRRIVGQLPFAITRACLEEAQALVASAAGDHRRAATHARQAAALWNELPAPLAVARCHHALAISLDHQGDDEAARQALGEAHAILEALAAQLDDPADRESFLNRPLVRDVARRLETANA